jgi:hypothetical protein
MKAIVSSDPLPKTNASIHFDLKYHSIKPTPGNYKVLNFR